MEALGFGVPPRQRFLGAVCVDGTVVLCKSAECYGLEVTLEALTGLEDANYTFVGGGAVAQGFMPAGERSASLSP
ncbi:MAG: hypothetical protein DRN91_02855 [Candidatus Alkanophagales archaeon]|nr:MAG: hypothetical protein DRN91_02855 [Candidatus Alkanophagales archaeon]